MQNTINSLPYMTSVSVGYKGNRYTGYVSKHLHGNKTVTIAIDNRLQKVHNINSVYDVKVVA